jgi:uncharacterized coiled-coil protein SlyX
MISRKEFEAFENRVSDLEILVDETLKILQGLQSAMQNHSDISKKLAKAVDRMEAKACG